MVRLVALCKTTRNPTLINISPHTKSLVLIRPFFYLTIVNKIKSSSYIGRVTFRGIYVCNAMHMYPKLMQRQVGKQFVAKTEKQLYF